LYRSKFLKDLVLKAKNKKFLFDDFKEDKSLVLWNKYSGQAFKNLSFRKRIYIVEFFNLFVYSDFSFSFRILPFFDFYDFFYFYSSSFTCYDIETLFDDYSFISWFSVIVYLCFLFVFIFYVFFFLVMCC